MRSTGLMDNKNYTYNEDQDDDLENGLLPRVWGPPMWQALHYISFGYSNTPSENEKISYRKFFELIGQVLPCKSCRVSYLEIINSEDTKISDEIFKDRKSLTFWLYKVHEEINKKIGVKYNISYENVAKLYESFRAKCSKANVCSAPSKTSTNKIKKYKFTI